MRFEKTLSAHNARVWKNIAGQQVVFLDEKNGTVKMLASRGLMLPQIEAVRSAENAGLTECDAGRCSVTCW